LQVTLSRSQVMIPETDGILFEKLRRNVGVLARLPALRVLFPVLSTGMRSDRERHGSCLASNRNPFDTTGRACQKARITATARQDPERRCLSATVIRLHVRIGTLGSEEDRTVWSECRSRLARRRTRQAAGCIITFRVELVERGDQLLAFRIRTRNRGNEPGPSIGKREPGDSWKPNQVVYCERLLGNLGPPCCRLDGLRYLPGKRPQAGASRSGAGTGRTSPSKSCGCCRCV
jgi:hypothetical protein